MSTAETLDPMVVAEAVADAYADDETLVGGDVPTETVAESVGIGTSQARKHLRRLAEAGTIERTWGYRPGAGPIYTYRPTDDDAQLVTDGGACVDEPQRVRVRVRAGQPTLVIDGELEIRLRPLLEMEVDGNLETVEIEEMDVSIEYTGQGTQWIVKSPVDALPDIAIEPYVFGEEDRDGGERDV